MGTLIQTASWNRVTNSPGFSTDGSTETSPAAAPATLSPDDPTVAPASSSPLNYYVRFTLSDGDVVTVNGAQFFALDGFSFSEQPSSSTGSQSSGAGAGKVTFNPLQLTLSQLGLQPALFQALTTGALFQEVDVLGYSQGSNQLVTDDSFGLVGLDNLSTDASGATQVDLEFGSEETNDIASPGVPGTLSPDDPTVAPASSSPLNYYVRFTLSDGDVVTVNGAPLAQFFALDGFSLSEQQSSNSQSSGAGASEVTFNPLQLTLSQLGLQPVLLQALTTGTAFQEVDVLGYSQGSNQLVTDDSFSLVSLDNLSTDASGETQVSLEFGSEQISFNPNPTGNSPPGVPGTLSPDDPTVAPASSSPLNYYVRFTLSDGDVVTVNGAQFFALDGFSFSEQRSSSPGSQSSGAGAGKVTFNPLQLTLSQLGLQPALQQALATGATFQEVDVLGYSQGSNQLVADNSFGLVGLDSLSTDASGATQVSLEFSSEETSVFDPGPTAGSASIVVGHGQSVNETALVDGLVTPGLAGDTETITAVTGNATLANGVITYTAPATGVDAFNYTVQDQLGDTASGTVNVTIDPGPTITAATPAVVEKGQSTEIGTVAAGLAGDTLTLEQTSGAGALSLHLVGGVEEVIYTAPAIITSSTPDAVCYSVNDQFGDTASGAASIQLDAGPTIAAVAHRWSKRARARKSGRSRRASQATR